MGAVKPAGQLYGSPTALTDPPPPPGEIGLKGLFLITVIITEQVAYQNIKGVVSYLDHSYDMIYQFTNKSSNHLC